MLQHTVHILTAVVKKVASVRNQVSFVSVYKRVTHFIREWANCGAEGMVSPAAKANIALTSG
jgi:hypothetical protein